MKFKVILLTIFMFSLSSCTTKNNIDVLYRFDTEKMGSNNMKIKIEELEHHDNYSLLRELVYERGSYAGTIMFSVCTSSIIAKNRGFSHFAILSDKKYQTCDKCEMSFDKTIGFLNEVPPGLVFSIQEGREKEEDKKNRINEVKEYLHQLFPEIIVDNKDADIVSVKDFWLVCKNVRHICSW